VQTLHSTLFRENEKSSFLRVVSGSLLHRQRSPEELEQLLAWYKIRDTMFGDNSAKQDIKKAFELASVCEHPNAVWLTKLFAGRDVNTEEEARQVFLGCENDPRAICFAGFFEWQEDEIRRAADLGDAYAQMAMAANAANEERFRWAEKSAAQGERDGIYWLGECYRKGKGCAPDLKRAKETFAIAYGLGSVCSISSLGYLFHLDDPQRFCWLGKAAVSGFDRFALMDFMDGMVKQVRRFNAEALGANVVFVIGRALRGNIDNEKETIFGEGFSFDARISSANQALQFYEFQLQSYRKAVDSWTIIGLRNKVVKDIRKLIGKIIWDTREEAGFVTLK
jgi:hypothetical protein